MSSSPRTLNNLSYSLVRQLGFASHYWQDAKTGRFAQSELMIDDTPGVVNSVCDICQYISS